MVVSCRVVSCRVVAAERRVDLRPRVERGRERGVARLANELCHHVDGLQLRGGDVERVGFATRARRPSVAHRRIAIEAQLRLALQQFDELEQPHFARRLGEARSNSTPAVVVIVVVVLERVVARSAHYCVDGMSGAPTIRACDFADAGDVRLFLEQRFHVYQSTGQAADAIHRSGQLFLEWIRNSTDDGGRRYLHWFVATPVDGDAAATAVDVVGGAGVWVLDWPPHPTELTGRRGKLMNVFVAPAFRRRGLASAVLQHVVAHCRERLQLRLLVLSSSDAGKALYERLGFKV